MDRQRDEVTIETLLKACWKDKDKELVGKSGTEIFMTS